ncbi:MAG TPA: hypothetical protein VF903_04340 [Nitrospirota bacterium]
MNKKRVAALCGAALLLLFGLNAGAEQGQGACVICHTFLGGELGRPVLEWNGSVHRQNGITCDLCHGGDASVDVGNIQSLGGQFADRMSRAMSKDHGFIGKPSGKRLFDMCSRCHYPSVARYAKSIMGRAYLDGKGGPSCVTCHHAHRNSMPEVPKVCESCHKDTAGFDQIDPMNVTESTVNALSGIRIKIAQEKTVGKKPPFLPEFPGELDAFQIGFVAFGAVLVLFIFGYFVYLALEKRK